MSVLTAEIPLSKVERIQIYINSGKRSLAAIKKATGADYLLNGGLYNMSTFKPVCQLKVDGNILAQDPYTYYGYSWDTGADIRMELIPPTTKRNHIACVELIRNKQPKDKPIYNSDLGGSRPRSAIGIKDGAFTAFCASDGLTPEMLRDKLHSMGWESAIMLDGGGSSQCDFNGKKITSSRIVHNLILVYLKKEKPKMKICLDAGHGLAESTNQSPDGTYKEHEFAIDMANRIKPLLERCGFEVGMTRSEKTTPALRERCNIANNAKCDLFLSLHTNASAGSGWTDAKGLSVYTYAAGATQKRNIAALRILTRMAEAGVTLRQLYHNSGLVVLAYTNMPAVLIEYGFHTNKDEVALLKTSAYRNTLATQTAKAVCDYFGVPWADPPTDTTKRFYIAFTDKAEAEAKAKKLKAEGFTSAIVEG